MARRPASEPSTVSGSGVCSRCGDHGPSQRPDQVLGARPPSVRPVDGSTTTRSTPNAGRRHRSRPPASSQLGLDRPCHVETVTEAGRLNARDLQSEHEVRAQIRRPAFSRVADPRVRYLPYGELRANREAITRLGRGATSHRGAGARPRLRSALSCVQPERPGHGGMGG